MLVLPGAGTRTWGQGRFHGSSTLAGKAGGGCRGDVNLHAATVQHGMDWASCTCAAGHVFQELAGSLLDPISTSGIHSALGHSLHGLCLNNGP